MSATHGLEKQKRGHRTDEAKWREYRARPGSRWVTCRGRALVGLLLYLDWVDSDQGAMVASRLRGVAGGGGGEWGCSLGLLL